LREASHSSGDTTRGVSISFSLQVACGPGTSRKVRPGTGRKPTSVVVIVSRWLAVPGRDEALADLHAGAAGAIRQEVPGPDAWRPVPRQPVPAAASTAWAALSGNPVRDISPIMLLTWTTIPLRRARMCGGPRC
jgi:hypothetical protein